MIFVNLSNHAGSGWPSKQVRAAEAMGTEAMVDIRFPNVPPTATSDEVHAMAKAIVAEIYREYPAGTMLMVMGEMTLTYNIVSMLKVGGYKVYAATTERLVTEKDGVKTSVFEFVQFREY